MIKLEIRISNICYSILFKVVWCSTNNWISDFVSISTKIPKGVLPEHLEIAKAIVVWQGIDSETSKEKAYKIHDFVTEKFKKLNFTEYDLKAIIEALDYLRADEFAKADARSFYREERERKEKEFLT